jgi:Arc/MetJ-type ribon-helix-helix transcriptional regulator
MLSADMSEFVRKSVVRTEPFGHERDVWIRVLCAYAGSLREPRTHPETDDSRAKEATP